MFDPVFWSVAALAVFVVALSKSGLVSSIGLIGVPLLTLVMPPREAAGMMLPVLLVMDAIGLVAYRREVDWRNLRILIPGAFVGIGLGWVLSSVVTDAMVLLGVGLITIVFILDAVLPLRKKLERGPPSVPRGVFWGAIAGFTSFVAHAGGPPYQVYVLPQRLSPALYAGTTAWTFAIINAVKLLPFYFLGQLSVENLKVSVTLVPVAVGGMYLGIYLVRRISAEFFYKLTYVLVFLLAIKLIYDGVRGVFFGL